MSAPLDIARAVVRADYEALRHGRGAVRQARDVVRVEGPDAAGYLQGQLSQDIAPLAVGDSADSLLLAPDGKIVALVRVSRVGDETFLLDCESGHGEAVRARLARFKLRSKFDMRLEAWQCLALRGAALGDVGSGGDGVVLVAPSWFNGWGGVDLLGPEPSIELAGLRWCGEAAWEACRIESGLPSMDHELGDGRTIPAEAGLVDHAVSFTKGCYTGQELVARLDARGSRVARRLCGVVLSGDTSDTGELLGASLVVPAASAEGTHKEVGTLTSVAWSPALDAIVGLAYVHRSVETGTSVRLEPASTGQGGPRSAEVRALPLR